MNLVVLGAPGAGKGTQARNLAAHFGSAHISTGDILRNNIRQQTALGIEMEDILKSGGLVPDEIAIDLVINEMKNSEKNGFVIDGFPRTLRQAKALENIAQITKAISIDVKDEVIIERMSGRLTCPNCGAMYHSHYHPPRAVNTCDACDSSLIQRDDDKAKTVENRLEVYHRLTEPIIQFYRDRNLLLEVNGVGEIDYITEFIVKSLEGSNGHNHKK